MEIQEQMRTKSIKSEGTLCPYCGAPRDRLFFGKKKPGKYMDINYWVGEPLRDVLYQFMKCLSCGENWENIWEDNQVVYVREK